MPRLTLSDVRASRIPSVLGLCESDPRLIQYVNEAVQRLLPKGHWWGTTGKFRICATEGCITLPRQLAVIEKAAVCNVPIPIRDFWYEFMGNGYGVRDGTNSCMPEALYRGHFPTFEDIRGVNKKLRFVCDLASDVGKKVLALGYDENGNWIRTTQDGAIKDGEIIALAQSPGTNSTNLFSTVTDIQFNEARDGQVWLYEYNTSDTTQRLIGKYEYDETRPSYARYFFPSVNVTNSDCSQQLINVIAKLDFIPVAADTDYLLLGNLPALKEMCRAIYLSENEPDGVRANDILAKGEMLAMRELDLEAHSYLGDGRTIGIDVQNSAPFGTETVPNFI